MGEPVVLRPMKSMYLHGRRFAQVALRCNVLDFALKSIAIWVFAVPEDGSTEKCLKCVMRSKRGDTVEVFTSKNQKPSKDWLGYVVSGKARSKIRQTLREEEGVRVAEGREMLERRLKNWKMEALPEEYAQLLKHYKMKQLNDFYAAIANETYRYRDKETLIQFKEEKQEKQYRIRLCWIVPLCRRHIWTTI